MAQPFYHEKRAPGALWVVKWVGTVADGTESLYSYRKFKLGHPAHRQSYCWLACLCKMAMSQEFKHMQEP